MIKLESREALVDMGYEYVGDKWGEIARSRPDPPSMQWHLSMLEMIDNMSPITEVWYNWDRQQWFLFLPVCAKLE